MKYKCLIVDDEEHARNLIVNHLSNLDDFEIVATCSNAIEATKTLLTEEVDLVFLDIEMPVLKGTDMLKSLANKPKVIFTTAYRDYAIEGFELDAIDYLLKPIVFERFFKAIQKFIKHTDKATNDSLVSSNTLKPDFIFVSENRKKVKINFENILYIESLKDYIKIHLTNQSHTIKYSISAFEKELDSRFIRIHRSYLANKDKITAYTKKDIEINAIEIPIGENYKATILRELSI